MNNRLKILTEIDKLEDKNCATCTLIDSSKQTNKYCVTKCDVGKKLTKLGNQLLKPNHDRIKKLLAKGDDLTYSEVKYLLDKEVHKTEIRKALGMSYAKFEKYLKQMSEGINMKTNIEKVHELSNKGLKPKEIAKQLGISVTTVYTYRSKAGDEGKMEEQANKSNVPVKENKENERELEWKKLYNELKTEYRKLEEENSENAKMVDSTRRDFNKLQSNYNSLEKVKNKLIDKVAELEENNRSLSEELNDLEEKCQDLSDKLTALSSVSLADEEYKRLQGQNEVLKDENSRLRQRNEELIDEARSEIEAYEKRYKTEKAKHETLFSYITLAKEVV